jgi:hypothetical protein
MKVCYMVYDKGQMQTPMPDGIRALLQPCPESRARSGDPEDVLLGRWKHGFLAGSLRGNAV